MPTQEHEAGQRSHARPAQRVVTRRRADADLPPPRHAAAGTQRTSSAGVRGRPRDRSRPGPLVLGTAAVALAAVALVGGRQLLLDEPDPAPRPRAETSAQASVVQAATGSGRTPASARAALEQLLAGRAVATTRLLRATVSDDAEMASAAETVLARTTADVGEVTRVWRGGSVADELTAVLDAQTAAAVAHAEALRDGNEAAAAQTLVELSRSSADLGAWLDRTTGGDVKALYPREDGGMLRAYAEAELRGDRDDADRYEQALQLRMSREGGTLATTVAGPASVASFAERQVVERWRLLFGRHAVLAGEVVRAGVTSADDAGAASAALSANTREVTALVGEVLPPERERAFADLWEDHADAVVDHARAATRESQERSAASTRLTDTARAVSEFLGEDVAAAALEQHAASLVEQADAWSGEGSADQAYTRVIADHATMAALGARTAAALRVGSLDS